MRNTKATDLKGSFALENKRNDDSTTTFHAQDVAR